MKKILSVILSLMLVFAGMAPASFASETADVTLSDISYENHSVFDFDPADTSYIVEQPYRFSKTGDNFPEPVVTATPTDPKAEVSVSSAKNDKGLWVTTIVVTNGSATNTYTLTSKPVGKNQYSSNPGFESGTTDWKSANLTTFETSSAKSYSGLNSLHAVGTTSVSYPWRDVNLTTDPNVTFFAFFAVNSKTPVKPKEPSPYADNSSKGNYVNDEGEILTDDGTGTNLLTAAGDDGWMRSMRVLKGVSILRETAVKADGQTTLDAYFDEFYIGPLVISEIKVTSDSESYIKCGEAAAINFDAELVNQYGYKGGLTNETVTWALVGAPDGVTINESTGELTVTADVTETGEFYVEAQVVPSFNKADEIIDAWEVHSQTKMGGRAKISVLPADAVAQLSDIEVNGGGIDGFTSATTAYDIYVPYVYEENNFNNYAMPVVEATPVDADGDVEITYPEAVADGEKIYIDVTDASGVLSTRYTLTIKTVGGNLFPDGGFETEAISNYNTKDNNGNFATCEIVDNSFGGEGNKVFHGIAGKDAAYSTYNASLFYGTMTSSSKDTVMLANKTYVNGFMVKLYPGQEEGAEASFDADVTAPNKNSDANLEQQYWRKKYAGDFYTQDDAVLSSKPLTLTDEWERYMAIVSSDEVNMRVGVDMGSNTSTVTDFLYDEMYLGELVIADMAVTDTEGNTSKTVTQPDAATTIDLTAAIENQYGNTVGLESETAAWSLVEPYDGVEVSPNSGKVVISPEAAAGTAIIEATVTPTYEGAAQSAVKKRYTLTIIPKDGFVDSENGTYTVNYTNNTDKDMTLRFISALYEGKVLKTVEITDNIAVKVGETISKSHAMTVGANQNIRNFLWDKATLTPIITE